MTPLGSEFSFKLGRNIIAPNLILAPMSGVTNTCFRQLIHELNPGALGLVVTEFISIEGLTRENAQSLKMMDFAETERPISIQIFGHDIKRMADAAKMVEDRGANVVDINCGCPVPKVVKKGGGCELMRQPDHLMAILEAVVRRVSIPVTLKIRAGWDSQNRNAVAVAKRAEECGIAMLAIHGRTRQDLYRGLADWEIVAEVASALSIPVIGSGDVVCGTTAKQALKSGVAGLMIGRGALADPWIFSEIHRSLRGEAWVSPADSEVPAVLERYAELLLGHFSERAAIGRLKQLASQMTRRVKGSASIRKALCTSVDVKNYLEITRSWRERLLENPRYHEDSSPVDNGTDSAVPTLAEPSFQPTHGRSSAGSSGAQL